MTEPHAFPVTPDGRYFIVRGRLWRRANPTLADEERQRWVVALMTARSKIRDAKRYGLVPAELRQQVEEAKRALGERGPVWWTDGSPDYNRHMAKNTPYSQWFATLR